MERDNPPEFRDIQCFLKGGRTDRCEDRAFACGRFAFVLDGATGVDGKNITGSVTDAEWFVDRWRAYLEDSLGRTERSVAEILRRGVGEIAAEYRTFPGSGEVRDKPSSALSLVRINGGRLEYYSVCDSVIAIRRRNREIDYILDDRLVRLDDLNFGRLRAASAETGRSILDCFPAIVPYIRENRSNMNTPRGYAALAHTAGGLETGLSGSVPLEDIEDVLLFSDGFAEAYDLFGIYKTPAEMMDDVRDSGAEAAAAGLYAAQDRDPDCNRFVRNKKRDDVSIIYFKL